MSYQVLIAELTVLSQEAKRKSPDIRTAADKSFQDLKSLPSTSEQQLAADLSRRPSFIDPFVLACNSRNTKLASSAVVCLQRLVVTRGIPRSRLKDVLDSFKACTALSMDVQLKILQALPALAQTYAEELKGDLLAAALQTCSALQNVKLATISGVATATFQQLVVSLFEQVASEDAEARRSKTPFVTEVPGDEGPIHLREAAFDAYRVFLDIALAIDGRRTKFVDLANFPPSLGLELIWSSLNAHRGVFATHPELVNILRTVVLPFVIRTLSERQSYPLTLRAIRLAPLILQQHIQAMPEECEMLLGLLTYMIEPDSSAPWKRAMCMEVFRSVYASPGLALQIFMQYDQNDGKKTVIKDNVSSFVRLSTEKPNVIGLGPQSSMPTGPASQKDNNADQVALEAAGGMAGVIPTTLSVTETSVPGISSQWSIPKVQFMDNLDKSEPPPLPETYIYTLILECLNSLSENLARVVLPLTVRQDNRPSRSQTPQLGEDVEGTAEQQTAEAQDKPRSRIKRSLSYRARTVPLNPLTLEHIPAAPRVKAIAALIEGCWPALLATSSTFLYSALDNDYYRSLIRSVQRFAQVAGLLEISTARDAFLTTLGKAAVPANLMISGTESVPQTPISRNNSLYSNAKGMLSVDSFASNNSGSNSNQNRRPSQDNRKQSLTTRNLLCLRALLNLAIAIGPKLETSFSIILDTLQQADVVLNTTRAHTGYGSTGADLGSETAAVGAAAMRLFESTADYPNDSFRQLLNILCNSLDDTPEGTVTQQTPSKSDPQTPQKSNRIPSVGGRSVDPDIHSQQRTLLLSKVGTIADLNVARFVAYPAAESGWRTMTSKLIAIAVDTEASSESRNLATDIVSRCSVTLTQMSTSESVDEAPNVQKLALSTLQHLLQELYGEDGELTSIDLSIHGRILDAEKTILDTCGETLTAGWDVLLTGVETAFHDDSTSDMVSLDIGRLAFTNFQMICSDFLSSVPSTSMKIIIQILFQFSTQDLDLNLSLTTITLFHDVSTFLARDAISDLNRNSRNVPIEPRISTDQTSRDVNGDTPANLWMLLLSRLADVVSDDKGEVRNSAFQTLLRILSDQEFSVDSWRVCLHMLLYKTLESDIKKQSKNLELGTYDFTKGGSGHESTSMTLLEGIASLISQNLRTIEQTNGFVDIWRRYLDLLHDYCALGSHGLTQASMTAMSTVLSAVPSLEGQWLPAIGDAAAFWAQTIPPTIKNQDPDQQQKALIAYTTCAQRIYRLTKDDITPQQIQSIAKNLAECVRRSILPAYTNDANSMTELQSHVMIILKDLKTDLPGFPSYLVDTAAGLVELPFTPKPGPGQKLPSFVAISKSCMEWLSFLLTSQITTSDLFRTQSVVKALHSLVVPMKIKYGWKQPGKQTPPWRQATSAALQTIPSILATLSSHHDEIDSKTSLAVWTEMVEIACATMQGDYSSLDIPNSYADIVTVEDDEQFDIASLLALRDVMIPQFAPSSIPASLHTKYATSLFTASLVHAPEINEVDPARPLSGLLKLRFGRIRDPEPSRREDLAYLCFAELIAMVSATPEPFAYHPSTTHTRPYEPAKEYGNELARAAAPYLLARFALPIKAYIADQPLRGRWPMPLSMVEELLWTLERMKNLQCVEGLFEDVTDTGGDDMPGDTRAKLETRSGPRAHLLVLHPLLIRAVSVAGHRRYGDGKILGILGEVLEVAGQV